MANSLFAAILNIAADAIISIDEQQNIVHYNQGAESIFGWTAAEAVGRPLDILIPERFRGMHKMHVATFGASADVARKMGHRREISGVRKNGEEFPADASISKLDTENGGRLYTVVLRDISERKRIEEDQRLLANAGAVLTQSLDLEDTLRTLVQLPVHKLADLCILDIIDNEDGNSFHFTRRITSTHPDAAVNTRLRMLESMGPPKPHADQSIINTVLGRRTSLLIDHVTDEWLNKNANAERAPVLHNLKLKSLICVPLIARGHVLGVLTLASAQGGRQYTSDDVSLADALGSLAAFALDNARLYQHAQKANRAREEILGVVSHDLQNPVSAIAMCAQALENLPEGKDTSRIELASAIREATKWMKRMISDLLDVSSIEAGKLSMNFQPTNMEFVVQSAVAMTEGMAHERSITVKAEPGDKLPQIHADAERIGQSLANLITNAIKFSTFGSTVTVRVHAEKDEIVFAVADTGAGIPEQNLPHIFNRYWQSRQAARRPGAGLGLAIVKGITDAHGGRVWVESSVGKGSTFYFSIPCVANPQ